MKEREKLGSRLGFILISAGCAIGIGNVWKFPYMAGQGGGGTFVLFYLIFLALLGLPVMTMEFSVGRASQKSPVKAYYALEKPGQKWHIHGSMLSDPGHFLQDRIQSLWEMPQARRFSGSRHLWQLPFCLYSLLS